MTTYFAIDLNTRTDPTSGWVLRRAIAISDTHWIIGVGQFDPDGDGPRAPYQRAFSLEYVKHTTCDADCDENNTLNIFDSICFGNAYAAGCP